MGEDSAAKRDVKREQWVAEQRLRLAQVFESVRGSEGQVHVAERAGVSRNTYNNIEKQTGDPRISTILQSAYALDLRLGDMLLAALPGRLSDVEPKQNLSQ